MCDISDLEAEIRDFINNPRRQFRLLQDASSWNTLCSALDVIGDTQLAIDAYLESPPSSADGKAYLTVYGILQVLFVQQDAVEGISEVLSPGNWDPPQSLKQIRKIRNDSIGHPIGFERKKGKFVPRAKSNFIMRSLLSKGGFNLMTVYSDNRPLSIQFIDISQVITEQRKLLKQKLREAVEKLREEEMKHKEEFRDKKLIEVFPPALGYFFQKIFEAISGNKPMSFGGDHLGYVGDCLQALKAALEERGLWEVYDSVAYEMKLAQYPLDKLKLYFKDSGASGLNEQDAYIFASFLRERLKMLKKIATEIDEEYEQDS